MKNEIIEKVESIFPAKKIADLEDLLVVLCSVNGIQSEQHRRQIDNVVKDAKSLLKELEDIRKTFTKPLDDKKALLMTLEKQHSQPANKVIGTAVDAINSFIKAEFSKARKEAARLELEQGEATSLSEIAANEKQIEAIEVPTGGIRTSIKWRVSDIALLPRYVLKVNSYTVDEMVRRTGLNTTIPGIEVYEDVSRSGR